MGFRDGLRRKDRERTGPKSFRGEEPDEASASLIEVHRSPMARVEDTGADDEVLVQGGSVLAFDDVLSEAHLQMLILRPVLLDEFVPYFYLGTEDRYFKQGSATRGMDATDLLLGVPGSVDLALATSAELGLDFVRTELRA